MADPYSREEQNNALLSSLSQKSTALRSLTDSIHAQAQSSHTVLDSTSETFSNMSTSIRGSAGRLTRSVRQGDRVTVLKVAAIGVAVVVGVWVVGGWVFGLVFGR